MAERDGFELASDFVSGQQVNAESSDFNQFVELENGNPVIDMEEAYIMYVALTRAREKLILSPACVEAISASAATKAGRAKKQDSRGAEDTVELRR